MTLALRRTPWLLLGAAVLVGCGLARSAPRVASGDGAPAQSVSDAKIAAIVVAANSVEILYADLALAASGHREVIAFATMVKTDHQSMSAATVALASKANLTLADNATSFDLRDEATVTRLSLRELEGFAFDSAYSVTAIDSHRSLLGTIDLTLVASVQNPELRVLLLQLRPAIAAHLEHAVGLLAKVLAGSP